MDVAILLGVDSMGTVLVLLFVLTSTLVAPL